MFTVHNVEYCDGGYYIEKTLLSNLKSMFKICG